MDTSDVPLLSPIPLKPINVCKRQTFTGSDFSEEECEIERQIYNVKNLNRGQRVIYDYMFKNPKDMILIQAGPGTGKTFTLMSIAHAWKDPVNVIIYKHDLLYMFRCNGIRYTVASFVMQLLNLGFCEYKSLEQQLSGKLNAVEFITCIVALLRRAKMLDFRQSLVILDEHTIVPKPLLYLTLMLLKYYKIGTIICGDKNQLQNIHNSAHIKCSSFDVAKHFVDRIFTLEVNERCADIEYNRAVEYISRFSSEKLIDNFGYAIVTALFAKKFCEQSRFSDIHLAARHQTLANTAHMLVINNNYPYSFYYIDGSKTKELGLVKGTLLPDGLFKPIAVSIYEKTQKPNKFLPYIPLVVGSLYFVYKYSEFSQATLSKLNDDDSLLMVNASGQEFIVNKSSNHEVIFNQHRKFLLSEGLGNVYNYPIYPANLMSIHKCQGCTIKGDLDLNLYETTYQGMYVSVSRVKSPNQITSVKIPNSISHLVSCVINFPEMVNDIPITANLLEQKMNNYVFYEIDETCHSIITNTLSFITSENATRKQALRDEIIREAVKRRQVILNPPDDSEDVTKIITINKMLKYKNFILALSCAEELDRNVWIHEFFLCSPEMTVLDLNSSKEERETTVLVGLVGLNNSYSMSTPSTTYIESKAKIGVKTENKIQYVIKEVAPGIIMETSPFRSRVYKMYAEKEKITLSWLVAELNEMMMVDEQQKRNSQKPSDLEPTANSSRAVGVKRNRAYTNIRDILARPNKGHIKNSKPRKPQLAVLRRLKK